MSDKLKITYPCSDAIRLVDELDDGLFKEKDEFVDRFWKFQTSQDANISTNFNNFLMGYTHWVVEDIKQKTINNICEWLNENWINYCGYTTFNGDLMIENLKREMEEKL